MEVIESRMLSAEEEISHAREFDYVTINDKLDNTVEQLVKIINN